MNNKVKVALISIMLSVLIHVIIIYLRLIKRIDLSISIGVITYFGLSYFLLMKYYKYKKTVLIGINIPYLIFYIPILLISFNRIHFISIIPNFLFLLSIRRYEDLRRFYWQNLVSLRRFYQQNLGSLRRFYCQQNFISPLKVSSLSMFLQRP